MVLVRHSWPGEVFGLATFAVKAPSCHPYCQQVPHVTKPFPVQGFWSAKCLATPPSENEGELLEAGQDILLPLCSARPELIARNLYWVRSLSRQNTSKTQEVMMFNVAFDREQDRELFAAYTNLISAREPDSNLIDFLTDIAVAGKGQWTPSDRQLLLSAAAVIEKKGRYWTVNAEAIRNIAEGIPSFRFPRLLLPFAGYFAAWLLCLAFYPSSQWVQANVIWHPRLRQIFFLFNPLLTAIPFLRRRLLAPFDAVLREVEGSQAKNGAYYADSEVVKEQTRLAS